MCKEPKAEMGASSPPQIIKLNIYYCHNIIVIITVNSFRNGDADDDYSN